MLSGDRDTVNEEFKELLEAFGEGRLSAQDRQRFDELCAADPKLAELRRQEESLTRLLGRLGPNHAPAGLSLAVFAQLDLQPELDSSQQFDLSRALKLDTFRRTRPWAQWWPALRWSFALAAVAAIGLEAGWLAREHLRDQAPVIASVPQASSNDLFAGGQVAATGDADRAEAWRLAEAERASHEQARREKQSAPAKKKVAPPAETITPLEITPAEEADERDVAEVRPTPKPTPKPKPRMTVPWVAPRKEIQLAKATPKVASKGAPGRSPAAPVPVLSNSLSGRPERGPADSADRQVALRVSLGAGSGALHSTNQPAPARSAPGGGQMRNSFAGGAVEGSATSSAPTLKDVEVSVYAAGGEILSREPVAGRPGVWRLQCRMTQSSLRRFTQELERSGARYEFTRGRNQVSSSPSSDSAQFPRRDATPPGGRKLEVHLLVEQSSSRTR